MLNVFFLSSVFLAGSLFIGTPGTEKKASIVDSQVLEKFESEGRNAEFHGNYRGFLYKTASLFKKRTYPSVPNVELEPPQLPKKADKETLQGLIRELQSTHIHLQFHPKHYWGKREYLELGCSLERLMSGPYELKDRCKSNFYGIAVLKIHDDQSVDISIKNQYYLRYRDNEYGKWLLNFPFKINRLQTDVLTKELLDVIERRKDVSQIIYDARNNTDEIKIEASLDRDKPLQKLVLELKKNKDAKYDYKNQMIVDLLKKLSQLKKGHTRKILVAKNSADIPWWEKLLSSYSAGTEDFHEHYKNLFGEFTIDSNQAIRNLHVHAGKEYEVVLGRSHYKVDPSSPHFGIDEEKLFIPFLESYNITVSRWVPAEMPYQYFKNVNFYLITISLVGDWDRDKWTELTKFNFYNKLWVRKQDLKHFDLNDFSKNTLMHEIVNGYE